METTNVVRGSCFGQETYPRKMWLYTNKCESCGMQFQSKWNYCANCGKKLVYPEIMDWN